MPSAKLNFKSLVQQEAVEPEPDEEKVLTFKEKLDVVIQKAQALDGTFHRMAHAVHQEDQGDVVLSADFEGNCETKYGAAKQDLLDAIGDLP